MKSGQLVVKNHRPMIRRLVLGVLVVLIVIGGAALFELGRSQGEFDRFEAGEAIEAMQQFERIQLPKGETIDNLRRTGQR